jgi:hypothetical protein
VRNNAMDKMPKQERCLILRSPKVFGIVSA